MENGTAAPASSQQVRVEFTTNESDLELPSDVGPMLLKTDLRRYELSHLVNSLLQSSTTTSTSIRQQPLEFHINGHRLRSSIANYLTVQGDSASPETTLHIEYSRGVLPPQHAASFPHPEWIGAVDVLSEYSPAAAAYADANRAVVRSGHERILTGSRDGAVRVWDLSGKILASTPEAGPADEFGCRRMKEDGRIPFVDAAKFASPTRVVAGGWWNYMRVWKYSEREGQADVDDEGDGGTKDENQQLEDAGANDPPKSGSAKLTPILDLRGHIRNVTSISIHPTTQHILSTSADGTTRLWSADPSNRNSPVLNTNKPPSSNKRVKLWKPPSHPSRGPLLTLNLGTSASNPSDLTSITSPRVGTPIYGGCFSPNDNTVAYTAGEDCTVQTWDLTTGQRVHTRTPHANVRLRTVCGLPWAGNSVIATGSAGGVGTFIVDLRDGSAKGTFDACLGGARSKSTGLCTDPTRPWVVCGSSDDGCVRGWDVRGATGAAGSGDFKIWHPANEKRKIRPVFRIPRRSNPKCDEVPGFEDVGCKGVCWDREVGIVSGGEDRVLQVDR